MIRKVFSLLAVIILIPSISLAQTSDFNVNLVFNNDVTTPSAPILLDIEPTAPTQIDIDWSASTDDYSVGGYVVLRNSLAIATTTLTSYMDAGLTPETLYSYSVYAFDTAGNISTPSNSLATTTLPIPIIIAPTSTPSINTGTLLLQLQNLDIVPGINTAAFFWQTNLATRFVLRWGRDTSYDDGYIVNDIYRSENQTLITDLEPGTVYLYELVGYTPSGIALSLGRGEFKTADGFKFNIPNVKNLQASVIENDVNLSWQAPLLDETLTYRIVRSHLGYPTDPYDGAVVYEGRGLSFVDDEALSVHEPMYYSIFVVVEDGTVSSGAVIKVNKSSVVASPISGQTGTGVPNLPTETQQPLPNPEVEIEIPDFGFMVENIKLKQEGLSFDFNSEKISLNFNEPFVLSIPYESLPEHLKSIVITILDPQNYNRSYSFLLRINKDRTAYESTIAPLNVEGFTRLQVEIFDYEREIIGRYSKQLEFVKPHNVVGEVIFPDKIVHIFAPLLKASPLLLLLLIALIGFLYIRHKRAEDNL